MVLCFVVLGMVVATPAQATVSWPIEVPSDTIQTINAGDNGQLSLLSCHSDSGQNSTLQAQLMDPSTGSIRSRVDSYQNLHQFCDAGYGYEADVNGMFYTYYPTTAATSMFYAWKNDRLLWSTDISSSTNCFQYSTSKNLHPSSMSVGADGNVWMILTASWSGGSITCADRLVAINPSNGVIVHDVSLSAGSLNGTGFNGAKAWTYNNYVLVLDRDSVLHKFNYSGSEIANTEYPYTFAPGTGRTSYLLAANAAGTVYAASHGGLNGEAIDYHKDNGATGTIFNTIHPSWQVVQYSFDHNGNFIALQGTTMDVYDMSSGGVVGKTPTNTTGYTYKIISDYVEDAAGNALVLWYNFSTTPTPASSQVGVSYVDAATNTTTSLFSENGSGTSRPSPLNSSGIDRSIADGSLYISLCRDQSSGCGSTGGAADSWIYKIDLSGTNFGSPVKHTYSQNGYTSTKLEYVAMGDSFSSGEGNSPFLYGSDVNGGNQCHRSSDAYPIQLENNSSLNLDLTAFVACSGAVMSDITNTGQYGEPAQADALSTSTDVVTVSIGGNDVQFSNALQTCVFMNNMPTNWSGTQATYDSYKCGQALESSESIINGYTLVDGSQTFASKFEATLSSILSKVGTTTQVYIIGYPNLFPEYGNITGGCTWASSLGSIEDPATGLSTSTRSVSEEEIGLIRNVTAELNSTMSTALSEIQDDRLHFEDVRAEFTGHEICSSNPDIYHINLTYPGKGSFHPNHDGEGAYANVVATAIG